MALAALTGDSLNACDSSATAVEAAWRASLRREIRRKRQHLTPAERTACARSVARALSASRTLRRARRVAAYLPHRGEADLRPAIGQLWRRGKLCYLPSLHAGRLIFLPYQPRTQLLPNRFGIPEPRLSPRRRWRATGLDVVLAPLVAFDARGTRLGMGGGYYDRTFAFLRRRSHWRRPLILGVAYAFQRVDRLVRRPWDVPLDGVVTELGLQWFPTR